MIPLHMTPRKDSPARDTTPAGDTEDGFRRGALMSAGPGGSIARPAFDVVMIYLGSPSRWSRVL